jgi:hypothetical protein
MQKTRIILIALFWGVSVSMVAQTDEKMNTETAPHLFVVWCREFAK